MVIRIVQVQPPNPVVLALPGNDTVLGKPICQGPPVQTQPACESPAPSGQLPKTALAAENHCQTHNTGARGLSKIICQRRLQRIHVKDHQKAQLAHPQGFLPQRQ